MLNKLLWTFIVAFTCVTSTANAQIRSAPQPAEPSTPIDAPKDIAYPGTLTLHVDARDIERRILQIEQTIPVAKSGHMVLLYPRWIPAHHSPLGPIYNYAGLTITANGKPLKWLRDDTDVHAFHVDVPDNVKELNIKAQFLTPTETAQGNITMSREMLRLNWYATILYPAGYFARRINVVATVDLPDAWQFGTALDTGTTRGSTVQFKPASLETLVDSPLIAGKHFKKIPLDDAKTADGRSRVMLNVMADEAEQLQTTNAQREVLRALVVQADKLFGARHYDHYDFLLWLSDRIAGAGTEHQRSSENGVAPKYFQAWDNGAISRDLLAHEYTHSWNGKYRRPADLWTPNLNVPMRDSLLWVYEGQTQYWGSVLAPRAGFLTKQQALDDLAYTIASYEAQVGRTWRNLLDTTNDPIIATRRAIPWRSYQRSEDYYREGALLWLEVDTLIRERSKNKRSLDDFARAFFGMNDGDWGQLTYTFNDVVSALNKVESYDWATLLRSRLEETSTSVPLEGIRRGGYQLVYSSTQPDYQKASEARRKVADLSFSLGMVIDTKGKITSVSWDSPAFKAGLISGVDVIAVNGTAFDLDKARSAVKATIDGAPIELLIRQGDSYRTVPIDYKGGLRYPKLERIKDTPALLDAIYAPRK